MAIPNSITYAVSFRVTCYVFIILPHNYFHMFIFPFLPYVNWNGWLIYNKVLFLCNFHFLMWSLLLMPHTLIGPFIFWDLGYLYQLVVPGLVPCVGLILPCRNFMLLPSCYVEFSLRWLRQLFTFRAFQRWTSWHLFVLLNASIISLWKLHCLWGPWG